MSAVVLLIALKLVQFTGPDQQLIEINPDHVVQVRQPRGGETHFHKEIKCLIFTTDGKFTGVKESCQTVLERLGLPDEHER